VVFTKWLVEDELVVSKLGSGFLTELGFYGIPVSTTTHWLSWRFIGILAAPQVSQLHEGWQRETPCTWSLAKP